MKPPTPRQQDCLNAIRAHAAKHGSSPSYRELASALGIGYGPVARHVAALVRAGVLSHDPADHRALRVVGACPCCGRR